MTLLTETTYAVNTKRVIAQAECNKLVKVADIEYRRICDTALAARDKVWEAAWLERNKAY